MIVGFSRHGTGSGRSAANYLMKTEGREVAPEVVKGDIFYTAELIESLDFKHKYTSGVLSFAPEMVITADIENKIIEGFEKVAFAGLEPEQYSIAWVRHSHAGHHELHFLTARVELSTGNSMNIRPPGESTQQVYDDFRTVINDRYGFASPDDPERARYLALPDYLEKVKAQDGVSKNELREGIHEVLSTQFERGLIESRDDIVSELERAGFEIPRKGKNYLTVLEPSSGMRVRMKGLMYEEQFKSVGAITSELREGHRGTRREFGEEISVVQRRLEQGIARRANYNKERYRRETGIALERAYRESSRSIEQFQENHRSGIGVKGRSIVGDSERDLSRSLSHDMAILELDGGVERESGIFGEVRESVFRETARERTQERLGRVSEGEREREVRSDDEGVREELDVWRFSVRENEGVGNDWYERVREAFSGSVEAFRERANRAREAFNEAYERLGGAVQRGYEVVRRVGETLRRDERDHEKNIKEAQSLERQAWRYRERERGYSLDLGR